ncbi:MAG: hypothetical protein LCH61_09060 [Proteobacteria bacterium]|nr:hypothetical protein [Pseudomonadota bacterium]MCA0423458.1 hypothetical protein [Pseudomonadota bacterium]
MADYFPLVSRAVNALDPNTQERREAIYARAREALDRQLLSLDPPIAAADLERERAALTDTIARVEAQFQAPRPITPPQPKPPAAAVVPVAPPPAPVEAEKPRLVDPTEAEPLVVQQRPKLEAGNSQTGTARKRLWMTGVAVGIPVLLAIGAVAYGLRDDPSRYLNAQKSGQAGDAGQAPQRKSDGRLDGSGSAPLPPNASRQQPSVQSALPVAARVVYFEETAQDPRGVQSDGQVVWRLETAASGAGQPPETIVRGTVSVPNAKMNIDLLFKRNRDPALPASHTIELIFNPEAGREGVKMIGPIEARDQESLPGYPLKGAMVPIGTNLFLIGLDNNEAAIQKNLEALATQKWFAFQFQLEGGKLGAALIEKGPTGERVFTDAIAAWSR